jgi:hypothetical protein
MLAPLLVLTLTLPSTGQTSYLDGTVTPKLLVREYDVGLNNDTLAKELQGGAELDLTYFFRPVRDDDAPPDLQPFLQRLPRLHLNGGGWGGTFDTVVPVINPVNPSGFLGIHVSPASGFVRSTAEGYIHWLYLGISVGVSDSTGYVIPHDHLSIPLDASLGIRWRDILWSAGWSVAPERDVYGGYLPSHDASFNVPFWGGAHAGVAAVISRRGELIANVTVLDGGASVEGSGQLWLGRRLGLSASVGGGHSSPSHVSTDSVDGGVSLAAWMTSRVAAGINYNVFWQRTNSPLSVTGMQATMTHVLTVDFRFRR